jgi:hypothetical protein
MNNDVSSYVSTPNYINNANRTLRPEKKLVDTLQLGLAALKIIENCQHCKDRLKEKYGGISEFNQILLE